MRNFPGGTKSPEWNVNKKTNIRKQPQENALKIGMLKENGIAGIYENQFLPHSLILIIR